MHKYSSFKNRNLNNPATSLPWNLILSSQISYLSRQPVVEDDLEDLSREEATSLQACFPSLQQIDGRV